MADQQTDASDSEFRIQAASVPHLAGRLKAELQTVWITGAGGLIGNYLVQSATKFAKAQRVVGLTRAQLELTDFKAVRQAFRAQHPQLVIHCAALSKSPACQANPGLARKVNVEATVLLTELAADISFVFFSTDLVFDGQKGNYVETDAVNPLSVYAETKVAAENIVLINSRHTVIRTSLNYGTSCTRDRAFNEEMVRAWQAGRTLTLFTDEFRCPIPAEITARAVWTLISQSESGLYHLAGSVRMSRWQIGELIASRYPHLHPRIEPGSLRDYQGPTRSPDTSLNSARIQALLPFPLPGLIEWLAEHPTELR